MHSAHGYVADVDSGVNPMACAASQSPSKMMKYLKTSAVLGSEQVK
jgi:hypothetical protein